ncbi:MAG: hypothetical protein AAF790_07535 [Planctomycetota bacterium]
MQLTRPVCEQETLALERLIVLPLAILEPADGRDHADPAKIERCGPFDPELYAPIIVETSGNRFWIMDGMTRVELARRAGLASLLAKVYDRQ